MSPGDTIDLTIGNGFPFRQNQINGVNIHFHGLTVSPNPPADETIVTLALVSACARGEGPNATSDAIPDVFPAIPDVRAHDGVATLRLDAILDPVTGAPISHDALPLHMRKARVTQVSIEANSGICRGMLRHRYNNTEGQGETGRTEDSGS